MKTATKLIVICLAAVLLLSLALLPGTALPVQAETGWQKSPENPVFTRGIASGGTCVIYDNAEGKYKMWFTRATTDLGRLDNLIDEIAALDLGNLVSHLRNLDFRAIAEEDASSLKTLLNYLSGLEVADLQSLLIGTASTIGYSTSLDGENWQFQSTVLEGTPGEWDRYYVAFPSVIKSGTNEYRMWYTGGQADLNAVKTLLEHLGLLDADDIEILLTDLVDLDIQGFIGDALERKGADYLLDFLKYLIDVIDNAGVSIGYATSTDGINWQKHPNNPVLEGTAGQWDKYGVATPAVVRNSPTSYQMWYTGIETDYGALLSLLDAQNIDDVQIAFLQSINMAIGYATSTDGINWVKHSTPVFEKGTGDVWDRYAVLTPSVIKTGAGYEMWYTGGKVTPSLLLDFLRGINSLETTIITGTNVAVGHASSNGGITWTRDANNPILSRGSGQQWDKYGVGAPSVVKVGDTYRMWYTGGKSHLGNFILAILSGSDLASALIQTETLAAIGYASLPPVPPPPVPPPPVVPPPVPAPAAFIVSDLVISPTEVEIGETVTISALVTNTGEVTGSYEVTLRINDITVDTMYVTLAGGAEQTVTFTTSQDVAGTYTVTVDGLSGTFTVKAKVPVIPPAPAAFIVSDLVISPTEVEIGETVTIRALITNTGDLKGSHLVVLKIDGVTVASTDVTLAGRASQEVSFTITTKAAGTYRVAVDGLSGTFVVREVVPPPPVKPAAFIISDLFISPDMINVGETVRITVTVSNVGEAKGSHEIILMINDKKVFSKEVTLAGGESTEVSFTTIGEVAGTYTVTVDGLRGTFTVERVKPPVKPVINWPLIIGIIAGVLIIGVAIWLIIKRRRGV